MEGQCHCTSISFKTKENPSWVGACHCIDCRKLNGAPYTVWVGFKDFEISGKPKEFRSSENVIRSFCDTCGSPCSYAYINKQESDKTDLVYFHLGFLNVPETVRLQQHIWVSQKLPWVEISDGLPQREQ